MHLQAIPVPTQCCENDTDISRTLSFYKTIRIMQHTLSSCDADCFIALWNETLPQYFNAFFASKSICFKCFFEVIHFVSSGNQISTFHWKWISMFMGLISPT
jgi:hypothetical protein